VGFTPIKREQAPALQRKIDFPGFDDEFVEEQAGGRGLPRPGWTISNLKFEIENRFAARFKNTCDEESRPGAKLGSQVNGGMSKKRKRRS
jgi:hypothetical protein